MCLHAASHPEGGRALSRPLLRPWAAIVIFIGVALAAVLLASAVIDGLASSNPSVTISVLSPTPGGSPK